MSRLIGSLGADQRYDAAADIALVATMDPDWVRGVDGATLTPNRMLGLTMARAMALNAARSYVDLGRMDDAVPTIYLVSGPRGHTAAESFGIFARKYGARIDGKTFAQLREEARNLREDLERIDFEHKNAGKVRTLEERQACRARLKARNPYKKHPHELQATKVNGSIRAIRRAVESSANKDNPRCTRFIGELNRVINQNSNRCFDEPIYPLQIPDFRDSVEFCT